jgi:predicted O-linked N-acetylglucosamine transferase (SPINDLY family)
MSSPFYLIGLDLFAKGNPAEAQQSFISSFDNNEPDARKALIHYLHLLDRDRDLQAAMDLLRRAIDKQPQEHAWLSILADMCAGSGDIGKAIEFGEKSLALKPDQETAALNLAIWKACQTVDGLEIKKLFENWAEQFMVPIEQQHQNVSFKHLKPLSGRRIKIAYISGDFKNHSVRYFIEPHLRHHNKSKFEIHAIMTMDEDEISTILKGQVEHWHNVKDMTDLELLGFIRQIEIDILVDLSGHTDGNRLKVFAMRAAPIQMTWFGYMNTLGIQSMDYRITDWAMCPPGTEANYTEKLVRFQCMSSYLPPAHCEKQYPSPYHHNGHVTMVSLNNSRKLSDITLQTWCEILNENSNAGLIIISTERTQESAQQELQARLQKFNAPMDRVAISARLNMMDFMQMASIADFALDPFPITGGTTTYHTLWMGMPILTINYAANLGVSSSTPATMQGIGMQSCIANSIEEYKNKAKEWINNPRMIDELRPMARPQFAKCALMAHEERTRDLEAAYFQLVNANGL